MPLFNYGRQPGYSPGGRGVNPETGRIGSLPGGMDYLAGFGPAPAGVTDTPEWTQAIPRRLGSVAGTGNPLSAFLLGLQKWGNPGTNGAAINMFNARHQSNLSPQQAGVPIAPAPMTPPLTGPPGGGAGAGNMGQPVIPGPSPTNGSIGMPQTPWTPSWGIPGLVYGTSSGRRSYGG